MPICLAAIEIYSAGKHYKSFEDYQRHQQDISFDQLTTEKSFAHLHLMPLISDEEKRKLDKISYNSNVNHALIDFQQHWEDPSPGFIFDADELEVALRSTMGKTSDPALLISNSGKLRILRLEKNIKEEVNYKN